MAEPLFFPEILVLPRTFVETDIAISACIVVGFPWRKQKGYVALTVVAAGR